MEFHPISNLFPLMNAEELGELTKDIQTNGLIEAILVYESKILDGRNRYLACESLGIETKQKPYAGSSPLSFVISLNLKRRHLTPSQKAAIAVDSLPMFEDEARKRQAHGKTAPGKTLRAKMPEASMKASEQAATAFGVSPRYISDAKAIKQKDPKAFEELKRGDKPITEVRREQKRAEVLEKVASLPSDKYRVIYADPPWKYGDQLTESYGPTKFHYPSMSITELCALPIKDIVQDNAVLFLWVTSPILAECWPVIRAWGFEYKSSFVWDKIRHNMGHYNSVRHEFLLICTRGGCLPDVPELIDSVQSIERGGKHSEKPSEFRKIIDTLYPHGKRIELFARERVKGWDHYGNAIS